MEPGRLPTAKARTTLRLTVPLRRRTTLEPILVKKLKNASDPTARIGGTLRAKINSGSKSTPPPKPVMPIRVPTTKPIRILRASSMTEWVAGDNRELSRSLGRSSVDSDEAFLLQVQDNFLRGFLRRQIARVD